MPTLSNGTEATWESHKSTILSLYFTENMTLAKVMEHMKQNHGFDASKGRYETQFQKWNLRKNLRSSEWKYVSYRIQKRKREGKESVVYFNRVAIAPEKVKKEISRHDVPTYHSTPIPETPKEVSVCTPASAATAPSPDDLQVASETVPLPYYSALRTNETDCNLCIYPVFSDFLLENILSSRAYNALQHLRSKNHLNFSSLFNTVLLEAYHGHCGASFRVQPEAALKDPLCESDQEAMLIFAAERIGLDPTMIFAQEARASAKPNIPEAIFPYVHLIIAAYCGRTEVLLAFLASEERLLCNWTRLGQIALHVAVEGSHTGIVKALTMAGVEIDACDGNNETALHHATRREDVAMMAFLLSHGHPVGIKNLDQETPLHLAAQRGHLDCVKLLVDAGADPSTKNTFGSTPLHLAAQRGHLDCVKLLVDTGVGLLYKNQGNMAEVEAMYLRALQGYEKALGAEHRSTLRMVNNLGMLYVKQGKMAEAEAMYVQALRGKEEALGAEHTSTLDTVNNLGLLYANQGKMAEAEAMYLRAMQGYEKALGARHTSTLDTVNNLGNLYAEQDKMAEALQRYKKTLGAEHAYNLGLLYKNQGKMAEAEAMYIQALQGKEKAFGAEHTSTLEPVSNLANLYADQGKMVQAEAMYVRALQGYEKALGAEHRSTLRTVNNLGVLYANQGKMAEAEAMYLRALQGKEKALGAEHTSTLDTVNNLGLLYANQGKMAEAEAMYVQALQGKERALGVEHTSTLDTVNNLGLPDRRPTRQTTNQTDDQPGRKTDS